MVSSQEKSIFECKWYAYCIEVTGVEGSIQVWIFQTVYLCTNKDHTEIAFRTFSFLVRFLSSHDLVRMQKSTTYFYRVSHIETNDSKWLWGVEGSIILLIFLWRHVQQHCTFEFHQSIFTLMTKLVLHSLRSEGCQNWTWDSMILPKKIYVFKTSK